MKSTRRLGQDGAPVSHSRVVPLVEADLSRSQEDILKELGLLNAPGTSSAATQEAVPPSSGLPTKAHEMDSPADYPADEDASLALLPIDLIDPGRYQPRLHFDEESISLLASTIERGQGLTNPVIVRPVEGGRYELIGGERRLRAHKLLGKSHIFSLIRQYTDEEAAIMSCTDNDAREDLSDYERGRGYKQLLDSGMIKHQTQLSQRVGKSMSTISRCLAYFKLPAEVISMLDLNPLLIGNKLVGEFVRFTDQGQEDLVIEAVRKIAKGTSQEAALQWLKAEVTRTLNPKMPKASVALQLNNGLGSVNALIDGQKLVLTCPKGLTPDQLLDLLKTTVGSH
ncbi:ParB/RepB/Spo0J family partition protein [Pseudomonas luteola]